MAICLKENILQKGQWYLELPLKIGSGSDTCEGKIPNYPSVERKLYLTYRTKTWGRNTTLFFPRNHTLSFPLPFLCSQLQTRTELGQKEAPLPFLQPQGSGNHLRARARWRLSVSLWFCGNRMFFLVWIYLLKQPWITYLSMTPTHSAKGFLSM